jgi:C-terminal processing protease CtpA/Prc
VAGLLGITIRHDSYDVSDNYIRVLEVLPGSPAEEAGLIPESDYILGTAGRLV